VAEFHSFRISRPWIFAPLRRDTRDEGTQREQRSRP
jgi:hypothetical protein